MRIRILSVLLFGSTLFTSGIAQSMPVQKVAETYKSSPAISVLDKMFVEHTKVRSLIYVMKRTERFEGEMKLNRSLMKYTRNPYKLYSIQELPKAGLEVLFVKGWNNDKALINTNGFPWVNVSLDPLGEQMRKASHHTALNGGFEKFVHILEQQYATYGTLLHKRSVYHGETTWEGRKCHKITIKNPDFTFVDYTVKAGEDLDKIANDFYVAGHMIMERNAEINDYGDVSAGQVIKIPTIYAPEIELYIDAEHFLPIRISVFDDKGLYERYEYTKLELNPTIPEIEYSKDNPAYGF